MSEYPVFWLISPENWPVFVKIYEQFRDLAITFLQSAIKLF